LIKGGKIMRMTSLFVTTVLTCTLLGACGGASNPEPVQGPTISGEIANWPTGKTATLQLRRLPSNVVFSSAEISNTGSFKAILPGPDKLKDSLLNYDANEPCAPSYTYSTKSFKKLSRADFSVLVTVTLPTLTGYVRPVSYDWSIPTNPTQYAYILFEYVDQDVTVTGDCTDNIGYVTSSNLSFKTGWNMVLLRSDSFARKTTQEVVTTIPSDLKWYWSSPSSLK
jgi:hypothetical protein